MSVLRYRRKESKAEYINLAYQIYKETLQYLSRVSARYSRLIASDIMHLAASLLNNCEIANSIYPSDQVRVEMRERHLLEARGALMALDIQLAVAYDIMRMNPQGCFTTPSGNTVTPPEAMKKLDNLSQSLGEKIDRENGYLTNLLKSDKKRVHS